MKRTLYLTLCTFGISISAQSVTVNVEALLPVPQSFEVNGETISKYQTEVATEVDGRIEYVLRPGQKFQSGHTLLKLNSELVDMRLEQLTIKMEKARLEAQLSRKRLDRAVQLLAKQQISEDTFEELELDHAFKTLSVNEAGVSLQGTRRDKRLHNLIAPYTGEIVELHADLGQFVKAGETVIAIASNDDIEIRALLSADQINFIDTQYTSVRISSHSSWVTAKIVRRSSIADPQGKLFQVYLAFDEKAAFMPGVAVTVEFGSTDNTVSYLIPRDALFLGDTGTYIMYVDSENELDQHTVSVRSSIGPYVRVSGDGLESIRHVVINSGDTLKAGTSVEAARSR